MKNFFTMLLVFFIGSAHAATYYFSSVSGDDSRTSAQAKNPSTPWKSLSKLNSFFSSLKPGDSVLLKRGETFSGSISIGRSGIEGSPVVISAYGSGNRPVITSLTPLTNWISVGNGLYESYNPSLGANLNMLLINDAQQPIGRYPNKGYLTLESHYGKTSITDNELSSATNWKDAELVIRSSHWVINRYLITSQSGSTLYYNGTSEPRNNYGYFIQNSIKTLDQPGEWYYNPATKKVTMYFGAKSPAFFDIKATTINYLVHAGDKSYIVFDNLTLKGANAYGFDIHSGTGFSVKNCDVLFSGMDGVHVSGHTYFNLENSNVLNSNNDGINAGSSSTIRNNYVRNSYHIAGMGQSGDGMGAGIRVTSKSLIEYNQVINSGFLGIQFTGDSSVVKNNYIDTFCFVKDDGGGIYAPNSLNVTRKGRKVIGNIVLNGIGASEGTDITYSDAEGIYLDDNSNGVEITGNTVANCHRGLLFHNSRQVVAKNNTFFNNSEGQLYMKYDGLGDPLRDHTITNNIFFAKLATQLASSINTKADDIASIGRLDSNYYARPIDDKKLVLNIKYLFTSSQAKNYYDLEAWKSAYNKDPYSKLSSKKIAPYKINSLTSSNKCAYGSFSSSTDVKNARTSSCTVSWENSGVLDGGYLKSIPSSASSSMSMGVGAVSASKKYILKYSLKGTGGMSISTYVRDSVYNAITSTQVRTVSTSRNENEMMFTPSANQANAYVVFKVDAQTTYYLDNIQIYEVDATITNPDDSIKLVYNASPVNKTVSLNGNYVDVKNNKFSNSIVLKPYTSAVLIKDGGTQATNANTAPSISITSPVANTTFTAPASVTINAAAADSNGKVSKVEFYNGSTLLGSDTASPYTFTWNNVAAGNYTITAKATDNGSLTTTSDAVVISVLAPKGVPSVSITSPVANATFAAPASVTINATASDADGTISKVEFYNADTLIGTDTASPYTFVWNNVQAGNYKITAKATNNNALSTTSAAVAISVYASNAAPSVSFTNIATNISFSAPTSVTLSATAADTDGTISKVEFYNADTLIGTVAASPYTFTWNNVASGTYGFRVKATDDKGAVTASSKVTISVTAPIVSQRLPHNVDAASSKEEIAGKANASLSLKVFPNPASRTMFVSANNLPQNKDFIISIISLNGTVLKTIRANTSGKTVGVNISSLNAGVYTIKAQSGSIIINKQFVKL